MQKIVTNLWFDGKVEEALEFYLSVFYESRVKAITRYGDAGPGSKGEIMTATFELVVTLATADKWYEAQSMA